MERCWKPFSSWGHSRLGWCCTRLRGRRRWLAPWHRCLACRDPLKCVWHAIQGICLPPRTWVLAASSSCPKLAAAACCLPRLVQGASPSLHQIDDTVMCAGSVPSIPYMLQPDSQNTFATIMWEVQGFVSLRLWGFQVEGVHFSISGHITKVPVEKAEVMLKQVTLQAGQLPACPAFNVSPQCSWWILGLAMFHALD